MAKKFSEYFSYFVQDADTSIKFIRTNLVKKDESQANDGSQNENSQAEADDGEEVHVLSSSSVAKGFTLGDYQYTGVTVSHIHTSIFYNLIDNPYFRSKLDSNSVIECNQ